MIALSPLLDPRSAAALLDLRARGFDLVVIEVSPVPFVRPASDELSDLSYRLWRLTRESLRARYEQAGVPVVEWTDGVPLERCARGGGGIQAIRTHRTRIVLATGSAARLRGVCLRTRRSREPTLAVLILAHRRQSGRCCSASCSLRRMDELLPWALVLLGIAYTVVARPARLTVSTDGAPLVAAGLLVCAELAAWSLDERHAIAADRAVVVAPCDRARRARRREPRRRGAHRRAFAALRATGLAWTVLGAAAAVLAVGAGGPAVAAGVLACCPVPARATIRPVRGAFV